MKKIIVSLVAVALSSCSVLNIMEGPEEFCRSTLGDLPAGFNEAILREQRKEPPNGALTEPYSREAWDKYWNHRIFYVWNVGPESCGGTYLGPDGPELIKNALTIRRTAGLPVIQLEERNLDKQL